MIQRKKKICKSCNIETYIFSRGECKSCAQKRYAKKLKPKRRPISKAPTKRHVKRKKEELDVMLEVWEANADIDNRCQCSECGKSLEFDRTHCAHILSKGAFPSLRSNPENIIILCFECHQQFDFGLRSEMNIYPFIEEKTFELKNVA